MPTSSKWLLKCNHRRKARLLRWRGTFDRVVVYKYVGWICVRDDRDL